MNFVKVGDRFINLDNVAEVIYRSGDTIEVVFNSGSADGLNCTELRGENAAGFLAILDKIASANWFAPVAKDELPF
jgi:hypothetical protein